MNKKYNILIIVIIFLIVLVGLSALFYNNLKNKHLEIEATITNIGTNYIIVTDDYGTNYLLSTEKEYQIGDRVECIIKNIKDKKELKEGTIVKIETISQNINFSITDNKATDEKEESKPITNNSSNKENNNSKQETTTTDQTVSEVGTDEDIINYFTNLNNKLDTYEQDKSLGESLKEGFITTVDFLFYDGKIKGKTFNELSSKTKIKVLQIALSIDQKIDKYFPNYKQTISTTSKKIYTNVKEKTLELYLDTTTKICQNDQTTCNAAKQGLKDLKESFSLTWDFIKEISGIGLNKLKDWYEIWKTA